MSKLLARAKVNLKNANDDYKQMGIDDAYVDDCCYNLQQAIEKTLKYIVEMNGNKYATNHDIRANINILNRIGAVCPAEKELRSLASTLYEWETSSRYRDDFVAVKEDIDAAMKVAETVIAYADSLCVKVELKDMDL